MAYSTEPEVFVTVSPPGPIELQPICGPSLSLEQQIRAKALAAAAELHMPSAEATIKAAKLFDRFITGDECSPG